MALAVQTVAVRAGLAASDPVPGSITASDQVNIYTFEGRAGSEIGVTMVWSGDLDARDVLIGPGGQSFNEAGGVPGTIATVLPRTGTYQLHVWSLSGTTGTYLLQWHVLHDVAVEAGPVSKSLDEDDPIDVRTVRSPDGGALTVSYPPKDGLPHDVSLLAANGDTLESDYGEGGFTRVIAPQTAYFLVVTADEFTNGHTYSLSLAIREPVPLAGGEAQGELVRAGQLEVYQLDSRQGDVATILVRPLGNLDPLVAVVQPDGTTLISQDDHGSGQDELFVVRLRQRGLHQIGVSSTSSAHATGRFRISVTQHAATSPSP